MRDDIFDSEYERIIEYLADWLKERPDLDQNLSHYDLDYMPLWGGEICPDHGVYECIVYLTSRLDNTTGALKINSEVKVWELNYKEGEGCVF